MRYIKAGLPLYIETPSWGDDEGSLKPCLTVDDAKRVHTGLIWADGTPVYRVPDPIGFGRAGER